MVEVTVEDHVDACTVQAALVEKIMHFKMSPVMTTHVLNGHNGVISRHVLYHAARGLKLATGAVPAKLVQDLHPTPLLVMLVNVPCGQNGETSQAVQ